MNPNFDLKRNSITILRAILLKYYTIESNVALISKADHLSRTITLRTWKQPWFDVFLHEHRKKWTHLVDSSSKSKSVNISRATLLNQSCYCFESNTVRASKTILLWFSHLSRFRKLGLFSFHFDSVVARSFIFFSVKQFGLYSIRNFHSFKNIVLNGTKNVELFIFKNLHIGSDFVSVSYLAHKAILFWFWVQFV